MAPEALWKVLFSVHEVQAALLVGVTGVETNEPGLQTVADVQAVRVSALGWNVLLGQAAHTRFEVTVGAIDANWPGWQVLKCLHDGRPASFWKVLEGQGRHAAFKDTVAGCDWYWPIVQAVTGLQLAWLGWSWKLIPLTQLWQMRLLVVDVLTAIEVPGWHDDTGLHEKAPLPSWKVRPTWQARHCVLEVAEPLNDWKKPGAQTVKGVHAVAVLGFWLLNEPSGQGEHKRLLVGEGATVWYWPAAHSEMARQEVARGLFWYWVSPSQACGGDEPPGQAEPAGHGTRLDPSAER